VTLSWIDTSGAQLPGFTMPALAEFTSDTRLYDIETPLGTDKLLVESWVGREELSTLYEWQIFCLSTDAHIELKTLLAKQVLLRTRLADGTQATRSGWVAQVAQLGADGGLARYQLTLVPWLWLATQRHNSRVFQDKTILQILEQVFAADGARAHWRTSPEVEGFLAQVRPRSYCCQYRESDYDFIVRLLAEEGIGFYFEETDDTSHSASNQRLVLFADSTAFADDHSAAQNGGVRYHRNASVEKQDSIQSFGAERVLQPAVTTLSTWDYKAARVISASLPTAHQYGGKNAPYVEAYDWAGVYAFASQSEAEHYVRILRDATDARFKTWFGIGSVRTFRAGTAFTLTDSPLDQRPGISSNRQHRRFSLLGTLHAGMNNLNSSVKQQIAAYLGPLQLEEDPVPGEFPELAPLPMEIANRKFLCANFPGLYSEDGLNEDDTADFLATAAWGRLLKRAEVTGYANRFTAIRADIPWRPMLYDDGGRLFNIKPTAMGSQTAIVVGPDGSTANAGTVHTDHLGRIRIRFHWQQEENNTCWVRVAQMSAGPGYGAQFIPRIGQEVAVKFFDNDIDRPMVAGVLYNGRGQDDDEAFSCASDHVSAGQTNLTGCASPAWHGAAAAHRHAGFLSGFKSVALGRDGYTRESNQLVFDDTTGRLRTRLSSDTASTQLNLGHLIHQADNYRGSFRGTGWEMRTDAYGAIRAGKGLLITTYYGKTLDNQSEPAGENTSGIALLKQAQGFAETFNRAAATHQTVQFILVKGGALNGDTQQSRIDGKLAPLAGMVKALSGLVDARDGTIDGHGKKIPHMHAPLVVVAAQAGIGMAASDGLHIAAGEVAHLSSGRDTHIAVGEALTVHSGQAIGVLAGAVNAGENDSGIQLIAGQGDIEFQAQTDEMTFAAKDLVRLISANSHIDFAAAKSIVIATEGGASMTIEGGNITFACPGTISIKAASKSFAGPANMNYVLPSFPKSVCPPCLLKAAASGAPFASKDNA
jgi:type VI secretion system secreted protein VgrG